MPLTERGRAFVIDRIKRAQTIDQLRHLWTEILGTDPKKDPLVRIEKDRRKQELQK